MGRTRRGRRSRRRAPPNICFAPPVAGTSSLCEIELLEWTLASALPQNQGHRRLSCVFQDSAIWQDGCSNAAQLERRCDIYVVQRALDCCDRIGFTVLFKLWQQLFVSSRSSDFLSRGDRAAHRVGDTDTLDAYISRRSLPSDARSCLRERCYPRCTYSF